MSDVDQPTGPGETDKTDETDGATSPRVGGGFWTAYAASLVVTALYALVLLDLTVSKPWLDLQVLHFLASLLIPAWLIGTLTLVGTRRPTTRRPALAILAGGLSAGLVAAVVLTVYLVVTPTGNPPQY